MTQSQDFIKKGMTIKGARVDLARGLLNRDNPRSLHNGILAYTPSDAAAVAERLNRIKRSAPLAGDTHRVSRAVDITDVLKTKIKGIMSRLGDLYAVETPAPYTPGAVWTATARVSQDGKIIVALNDLDLNAEVL